jgi:cell division protein ZapE
MRATLTEIYEARVAGGTLRADPAQHAVLPGLEQIRLWLEDEAARPKGGLRGLFS